MIENLKRSKKMLQLLIECKGKKMQVLHDTGNYIHVAVFVLQ